MDSVAARAPRRQTLIGLGDRLDEKATCTRFRPERSTKMANHSFLTSTARTLTRLAFPLTNTLNWYWACGLVALKTRVTVCSLAAVLKTAEVNGDLGEPPKYPLTSIDPASVPRTTDSAVT